VTRWTLADTEQSVPRRFEEQASRRPDKPALAGTPWQPTFAELGAAADATARAVLSRTGGSRGRVAVLMRHDAPLIAAVLGVLKAGHAAVVLDPRDPPVRLDRIRRQVEPDLVLVDPPHSALARSAGFAADALVAPAGSDDAPEMPLEVGIDPDDLAVVLYTADYAVRKHALLHSFRRGLLPLLGVMLVVGWLLLGEPDFGAFVVICAIAIAILFLAGMNGRWFAALVALAGVGFTLLVVTSPYRVQRIFGFMDPWADAFGRGYQLSHALIAFGRGEWFGVGLGVFKDLLLMFSGDQIGDLPALLVCVIAGAALAIIATAGRGPPPASPEMTIEVRREDGEPSPPPEDAEEPEEEDAQPEPDEPEPEPAEPERDPRLWSKPTGSSSPPPGRRRLTPSPSVT